MSGDYNKSFKLEVEIQENGIIRDPIGLIIGRCDDVWLKRCGENYMKRNMSRNGTPNADLIRGER